MVHVSWFRTQILNIQNNYTNNHDFTCARTTEPNRQPKTEWFHPSRCAVFEKRPLLCTHSHHGNIMLDVYARLSIHARMSLSAQVWPSCVCVCVCLHVRGHVNTNVRACLYVCMAQVQRTSVGRRRCADSKSEFVCMCVCVLYSIIQRKHEVIVQTT